MGGVFEGDEAHGDYEADDAYEAGVDERVLVSGHRGVFGYEPIEACMSAKRYDDYPMYTTRRASSMEVMPWITFLMASC